jgi:small subunit ribosomal protein S6
MVSRYEVLILTVPEITADESKNIESQFDRVVKEAQGTVISFEKWGKYKLAYPIRKSDYGVYFLARFEVEHAGVEPIRSLLALKFYELVMRHIIIQLDPKQSLEYQKPPSLEDAPTSRDVNTFLKENRMEGLMSSEGAIGAAEDYEEDLA